MNMDMDMDMSTAMENPPHQGGGGSHGGGMDMMHQMSPFLFTRSTGFFVLFKEADIQSTGAFVGALFLSALFALLATVLSQVARVHEYKALASGSLKFKITGSIMHGFRQFLHYIAMLIVMTMNVWLIIAVVIGHVLGWLTYAFVLSDRLGVKDEESGKIKGIGCDC